MQLLSCDRINHEGIGLYLGIILYKGSNGITIQTGEKILKWSLSNIYDSEREVLAKIKFLFILIMNVFSFIS